VSGVDGHVHHGGALILDLGAVLLHCSIYRHVCVLA